MKERLVRLIELEKLTSSMFADAIGVQRSAISHILSGRNNPSYDLIVKILSQFPHINAEWLLTGKGNMRKTVVQQTIFDDKDFSNSSNSEQINENLNSKPDIENIANVTDVTFRNSDAKNIEESNRINNLKEVVKIITLYSDNTFDIYIPSK